MPRERAIAAQTPPNTRSWRLRCSRARRGEEVGGMGSVMPPPWPARARRARGGGPGACSHARRPRASSGSNGRHGGGTSPLCVLGRSWWRGPSGSPPPAPRRGTTMEAIVQTKYGRVRGTTAANGVCAFLGLPYAAPPVAARRLRPPQPVQPWTGIRDATAIGPEPPQPRFNPEDAFGLLFDPAVVGDDCLNLNIWTPDVGAVGLPVVVFSPGGAFRFNSGGSYDGSRFARDGVVCVTINWRTGADGFLYLGDGDDGANLGLLDQDAALLWVRENIGAFGGDPERVTVFGESAGAMSIGDLLSMPRAAGTFRRAALESGAAHHVVPADEAARIGARFAEALGVPATREAIAQVPVTRFLEAQARIEAELVASPDPARWGAEAVASVMPF